MIVLDQQSKIGFIGSGRVAGNLAAAFVDQGYNVVAVSSKNEASARDLACTLSGVTAYSSNQTLVDECDVIFVTVPDDVIESVVTDLSWSLGHGVVHCSGSRTLDCLGVAVTQGAKVASFHPLQTFPTTIPSKTRLQGIGFAVAGNSDLVNWLQEIIVSFGGIKLAISDDSRSMYHASAVMACGYVATALQHSLKIWESLEISNEMALAALMPLLRTTMDNIQEYGVNAAATGPIIRGDINTIQGHLESLREMDADILEFYAFLGKHAIRCNDGVNLAGTTNQQVGDLLSSYLNRVSHSIEA